MKMKEMVQLKIGEIGHLGYKTGISFTRVGISFTRVGVSKMPLGENLLQCCFRDERNGGRFPGYDQEI
jgi:hypothetical protein